MLRGRQNLGYGRQGACGTTEKIKPRTGDDDDFNPNKQSKAELELEERRRINTEREGKRGQE
jgi:hypothetical protein